MRIKLFAFLLWCLPAMLGMNLQASDTVLVLQMKTGDTHQFFLSEQPVVTFEGDRLAINSYNEEQGEGTSVDYARSDVEKFYFTSINEIYQGIETVQNNEFRFVRLQNDAISIYGLNSDKGVNVYDMQGRLCPADIAVDGNAAQISLTNLPGGTYVIQIGKKQPIKVLKK